MAKKLNFFNESKLVEYLKIQRPIGGISKSAGY